MDSTYKNILIKAYKNINSFKDEGQLATYIPELANVDPSMFGVHMTKIDGSNFGAGDYLEKFSIQSIAKVLTLTLAYKIIGEDLWKRIDVEPSGTKFDSLLLLETYKGIPRNPFVNSGAIVICDILISLLDNAKEEFLDFIRDISDLPDLTYSDKIADSEKKTGYKNVALCNFLKSFGNIKNEPDDVLDFYFDICSLEMTCQQLSQTFTFLANKGVKISDGKKVISKNKTKRINALMLTCGFYDESGEFAFRVGLPGKSGVGGGIVALYPDNYSIAVWSPQLNKHGNSYKGMELLENVTTHSELSIF
ncbi:glutaminase [Winogradskyella bathintestinalis]|uniref:Glutaminase n=1 Tax=Winogradskyella bathintestinalis TaxID=3035208 RepID=A0ABT7ZY02_9FLAO|nr:glutaminase [Winogradskyella bathintestinalis]MDN3493781.1 glutaminase [Winogradskyella bathintestinalis]